MRLSHAGRDAVDGARLFRAAGSCLPLGVPGRGRWQRIAAPMPLRSNLPQD